MRRTLWAFFSISFLLLSIAKNVNATLATIGTATYNGSDYNLIWDDDNNGNSVVWLDYTKWQFFWGNQMSWAAGLDAALTLHLNPGCAIIWNDAAWRLPTTMENDAADYWGYDGTTTVGWNITTSEMGHLFYEELGNLGVYGTDGLNQPGYGLAKTGDFAHLSERVYWSQTKFGIAYAYYFDMHSGDQGWDYIIGLGAAGLALRTGQVTTAPVPEPSSRMLIAAGLLGLAGLRRKWHAGY